MLKIVLIGPSDPWRTLRLRGTHSELIPLLKHPAFNLPTQRRHRTPSRYARQQTPQRNQLPPLRTELRNLLLLLYVRHYFLRLPIRLLVALLFPNHPFYLCRQRTIRWTQDEECEGINYQRQDYRDRVEGLARPLILLLHGEGVAPDEDEGSLPQ